MTFETVRLGDVVLFNPRESIKKGVIAKKIDMSVLQPFTRDVPSYELLEYKGGTKFRNGDTIMARITPCLENGKTAKVNVLEKNEVGFGSTEYIVFRAIDGISDEDFVYYLVCSPIVREPAIKSMVGSSGRQRVQTDVLQNLEINLPDLETQRIIGSILRGIDDRISLNTAINENLEQQAQAIFVRLFGDKIGDESNSVSLGDLIETIDNRGKTPPLEPLRSSYPIIDVKALSGDSRIINYNNCTKFVNEDTYNTWFRNGHPKEFDILISTVGSLAEIKLFLGKIGCIAQNVVGLRTKKISPLYLYQYLSYIKKDLIAYNIGSVQPSIKVTHIIKHLIYIPDQDQLDEFNSLLKPITIQIYNNCNENQRLSALRDTLLPKLMSGEIDVSQVKI